jgi:subtilisin family serine protease
MAGKSAAAPATEKGGNRRIHEGRILAQCKATASWQIVQDFHSSQGARVIRKFRGLHNLEVLEFARRTGVDATLQVYRESGLFEFVEPDYLVSFAAGVPNDPKFVDGSLWALNNFGQNGGLTGADISAQAGWAIRHCASNIVVAVIDSGVRYTHEDLASNMWRHPVTGVHGTNAIAGTTDPNDDNGHGTLVAGIIGASGNNGKGVAGIAWNVRIMACKFADRFGNGAISDAIACMDYATENGANIINASWFIEEYSAALSNAVHRARQAGVIVVAAAGNRSVDTDIYPNYPACLAQDNVVAVTATTRTDNLRPLSNWGAKSVHLGAPGDEILSTNHSADDAYATRYGTSMSAAYVSGVLALVQAQYPGDSHIERIQRLLSGTDPVRSLDGRTVTGGRLNLFKALRRESPPPDLTVRLRPGGDELEIEVSGEPGEQYLLQATADFRDWSPISTGHAGAIGILTFTTPIPTNSPLHFYRVWRGPL